MANNGLDSSDLDKITSFTTLRYLSLAYNKIDNVSSLENLKYLTELRLHNNQISDVRPLKKMIYMEALYPVSYTHLDVYKRQTPLRSVEGIAKRVKP